MRLFRSARTDPSLLTPLPIAHRGLHGDGRVENSPAAFAAAIAAGHGIELDVQASRDGEAMVFHDARLERLTGEAGEVAACSAAELGAIGLLGSADRIPTLAAALGQIGGRVPLLIEVKAPGRRRQFVVPLCRAVLRALEGYSGPVGVMSFNPEVARWFGRNAPQILRGLVVSEEDKKGLRGRAERRLSLWRAVPHFLAYDVRDLPSGFAARCRRSGLPVFTWTVRSAADHAVAAEHADQIVYEAMSGETPG
jgi:glycerophosphoryl diester phosphodiesterase